jgi:hypothetical protein
MTLQQRHNIKQEWFKGVENIREILMPNEARRGGIGHEERYR